MDTVLDSTILDVLKITLKSCLYFLDINTIYCAPARDKEYALIHVLSNPHGDSLNIFDSKITNEETEPLRERALFCPFNYL